MTGTTIGTKACLVSLALAVALSSCTSSPHRPAATGSSTTSTSAGSTTEPTASGTPIVAPTSAPGGPARCATSVLAVSLTGASGAAGSTYYTLLLTNRGSAPCVLQGYPGVSFVTGAGGQQIGAPAARISGPAPTVQVAPGGSAGAALQISVASNFGSGCQPASAAGLRVFPPNQTAALFLAQADQTCSNPADVTLHVGALQSA
jgi:hypothetical protein